MTERVNPKLSIFPAPILNLPAADIPLAGLKSYLSQSESHQIIFMEFSEEVAVPEHSHESQWAVVLRGEIELTVDGVTDTYIRGDTYYIPAGVKHAAKIHAGYADVTFFNQSDRYQPVQT